ncbi:MAG: bifunctional (p)ppGpp synthetase/guanosine-3',5'-bis(diphosphate) 3'-pyrophosphohydrolase [Clostridia bacterium]|nr:bifunctional (p)ppGpp synthetase/guanosine-3',5'-bis(diphosphate) 3'-pyrophosphohydrolase [Clostridia bacterium]
MNTIEKAIQFATKAHEGACRKETSLPYIIHPLEAASIAAQITNDPEVIAAAVLHDVIEDTSFTEANIRVLFGNRVADLVTSDTEDKQKKKPAAVTWLQRKQATIHHLEHASNDELIVVFSDKLFKPSCHGNRLFPAGRILLGAICTERP